MQVASQVTPIPAPRPSLITQSEIELQDLAQAKQDLINSYLQSDSTVWVGKTEDGLKDIAVVMGNDMKTKIIEII